MEILEKLKNKYVFFDVDGTLAEYRFRDRLNGGELGCQSLHDFLFERLFEQKEPFKCMQELVKKLDSDRIFILGAFETNNELEQKYRWINKHFPQFKSDHMIFISKTMLKPEVIIEYSKKYGFDLSNTAFVDDKIDVLRKAEELGIKAYHISSFIN